MNQKKTFIALITDENEAKSEELEDKFYTYCLKHRKQIMAFAGDFYTTLSIEFGVKKSDLPIMLIEEFKDNGSVRRYKSIPSDFQNDGIEKFFENYFEGKLRKFLKSEKVPEPDAGKEGNIYKLVGDTFDKFISQEDKWILVFFTRNKCNMCNEVSIFIYQVHERVQDYL